MKQLNIELFLWVVLSYSSLILSRGLKLLGVIVWEILKVIGIILWWILRKIIFRLPKLVLFILVELLLLHREITKNFFKFVFGLIFIIIFFGACLSWLSFL